MTAHIAPVLTAASDAASTAECNNVILAAHTGTSPLTIADAPQFNTVYNFTVTRIIFNKDKSPFLLKGYVGIGGNDIVGTVHASAIIGESRTERDSRFGEIKVNDKIDVEILDKADGYRFSERLAHARKELTTLTAEPKLTAVVLEDANEDTESLYVLIGGKHKARLHASNLKESSREARDARIQTLKKDENIDVTIKAFARHPKFPVFQITCQEVGRQEKKASISKPANMRKAASPLGNRTGDRAAAEAKRLARRQRDQEQRNKMKTAGGKK